MITRFCSGLLAIFILSTHVQAGELVGQISILGTSIGIQGAKITAGKAIAIADQQGNYALKIPDGDYTVYVSAIGYEAASQSVKVSGTTPAWFKLNLHTEIQAQTETVVANRLKPATTVQQLDGKTVRRASQSVLFSDAISSLKRLSGVASKGAFDSRLIIQGGADNELVTVLDDVPIYRPFFFGGRLTILDARLGESLDFYPAGFSVRGGQALSGLIDYHLKDGDFSREHGEFEWNLTEASAQYSHPIESGKSTLFIGARRTYYDLFTPLFLRSAGGPVSMPFIQAIEAKYTDKVSVNETRRLGFHFFNDGANTPLNSLGGQATDVSGQLIYNTSRIVSIGQQKINWTPYLRNELTASISSVRSRARITDDQNIDASQFESNYLLRNDVIWTDIPNHEIRLGAIGNTTQLVINQRATLLPDPEVPGTVTRDATLEFSGYFQYGGIYIEDNWTLLPTTILTLGYRLDAAQLSGQSVKWGSQPRMALKWDSNDQTQWQLYWGTFRQQKFELDRTLLPDGTVHTSFSDLQQDRAIHSGIGMDYRWTSTLKSSIDVFHKQYDLLSTDIGTSPEMLHTNIGEGRAFGIEFLLHQHKTAQMEGWVSYTYTNSRLYTPKHGWHSPEYDIPHVMHAFGEFSAPNNSTLTLSFTAQSGSRYTPILGSQSDPNTGASVYTLGEYLSQRLPPYIRLDVWVEMPGSDVIIPIPFLPGGDERVLGIFPKYKLNGKTRWGIFDILAIRNPVGYTYNKSTQTEGFIYDLPIMPIFGQTVTF